MGPVSLKRRVRSLGADLVLESRPGHGAGLRMKIPI
jgi:signal transduction histidine kinase